MISILLKKKKRSIIGKITIIIKKDLIDFMDAEWEISKFHAYSNEDDFVVLVERLNKSALSREGGGG